MQFTSEKRCGQRSAPQGVEAAHLGVLPVNQTDEFYFGARSRSATAHWVLLPVDWTDFQEEEVPAQPESRPTPPQEWMSDAAPATAFLAEAPAAFLSAELADAAFATVPVWEDSGLALRNKRIRGRFATRHRPWPLSSWASTWPIRRRRKRNRSGKTVPLRMSP